MPFKMTDPRSAFGSSAIEWLWKELFNYGMRLAIAILICLAGLLNSSVAQQVDMDELVGRSHTVVEGEILELRSTPLKMVEKGKDETGARITEFIGLDDGGYRELLAKDPDQTVQLTWRHIAVIKAIKAIRLDSSDSKMNDVVVEYITYPEGRSYGYQGALPRVGGIFTFFLRDGDLFPGKGGLGESESKRFAGRSRVDLPDEIGPPGIVKTLARGENGRLRITEETPRDVSVFGSYLGENGRAWKPPTGLNAVTKNADTADLPSANGADRREAERNTNEVASSGRSLFWPTLLLLIIFLLAAIVVKRKLAG